MTKTKRDGFELEARIHTDRRGEKTCELRIKTTAPMGHRAFRAGLLRLGAEIELATPEREEWIVHVENGEVFGEIGREIRMGRIWIETANGTDAEYERALATLVAVAKREDAR